MIWRVFSSTKLLCRLIVTCDIMSILGDLICDCLSNQSWVRMSHVTWSVRQYKNPPTHGLVSWPCALASPDPRYSQTDRTEPRQPVAKCRHLPKFAVWMQEKLSSSLSSSFIAGRYCHKLGLAIMYLGLTVLAVLFRPDFAVQTSGFGVGRIVRPLFRVKCNR
jgi:hypothetical protein